MSVIAESPGCMSVDESPRERGALSEADSYADSVFDLVARQTMEAGLHAHESARIEPEDLVAYLLNVGELASHAHYLMKVLDPKHTGSISREAWRAAFAAGKCGPNAARALVRPRGEGLPSLGGRPRPRLAPADLVAHVMSALVQNDSPVPNNGLRTAWDCKPPPLESPTPLHHARPARFPAC